MIQPSREYLYGINPAFESIRAGRRTIHRAFLNQSPRSRARLTKLASFLDRKGVSVEWVEKGRLIDLSGSREHQGVVLETSPYPYVSFDSFADCNRLLLLDNIEDPHNVGAILRSADIFGFHAVLLPRKGVPDIYPSVVKVSAGATEFLRIAKDQTANDFVKKSQDLGYQVVVLDAKGTTDIRELNHAKLIRLLLVIGGEDRSVGQFILNAAHDIVRVPQHGHVNSLNASVAAGIAMFALSENHKRQCAV